MAFTFTYQLDASTVGGLFPVIAQYQWNEIFNGDVEKLDHLTPLRYSSSLRTATLIKLNGANFERRSVPADWVDLPPAVGLLRLFFFMQKLERVISRLARCPHPEKNKTDHGDWIRWLVWLRLGMFCCSTVLTLGGLCNWNKKSASRGGLSHFQNLLLLQ